MKKDEIYLTAFTGLFVINLFLSNLGIYGGRTSPALLLSSAILLVFSCLMVGLRQKGTRFPVKRWIPFIGIGILFFIYGIKFKVPTYIVYAFIFLFQMPVFIFSIDREILTRIILSFSKWFVLLYSLYIAASFLISPLEKGQYCGIFTNPNLWGECTVTAILVILYLFDKTDKLKFKTCLALLFGISVANVLLSRSRTTLVVVIAVIIVYIVYIIRIKKYAFNKKAALYLLAIALLGILLTYVILINITPYTAKAIGIEIGKEDLSDGFEESISGTYGRYLKGINDDGSISSGRVEIWKTYIPQLSISGHDAVDLPIEGHFEKGFKTNAHNTFIQIGYQGGIPALVLFVAQFIIMGIFYLRKLFGKEVSMENYLLIASFGQAIVYMMLANPFGPYSSFSLIIYWMYILPTYMLQDEEPCHVKGILPRRSYFK